MLYGLLPFIVSPASKCCHFKQSSVPEQASSVGEQETDPPKRGSAFYIVSKKRQHHGCAHRLSSRSRSRTTSVGQTERQNRINTRLAWPEVHARYVTGKARKPNHRLSGNYSQHKKINGNARTMRAVVLPQECRFHLLTSLKLCFTRGYSRANSCNL